MALHAHACRGVIEIDPTLRIQTVDPNTACFSLADAVCVLVATSAAALLATSYAKVAPDARQRIQHDEPVKLRANNGTVHSTARAIVDVLHLHPLRTENLKQRSLYRHGFHFVGSNTASTTPAEHAGLLG